LNNFLSAPPRQTTRSFINAQRTQFHFFCGIGSQFFDFKPRWPHE